MTKRTTIGFIDHNNNHRIVQVNDDAFGTLIDIHPPFAQHEDGSGAITTVRINTDPNEGTLTVTPVGFKRDGYGIMPFDLTDDNGESIAFNASFLASPGKASSR